MAEVREVNMGVALYDAQEALRRGDHEAVGEHLQEARGALARSEARHNELIRLGETYGAALDRVREVVAEARPR